jgi:hypothetical protein
VLIVLVTYVIICQRTLVIRPPPLVFATRRAIPLLFRPQSPQVTVSSGAIAYRVGSAYPKRTCYRFAAYTFSSPEL